MHPITTTTRAPSSHHHAPLDPITNTTSSPLPLKTQSGLPFTLLPYDSGILIHGWRIERAKGPISNSHDLEEFETSTSIHCPEMSFLSNHLTLIHEPSGTRITFDSKEALRMCLKSENEGSATVAVPQVEKKKSAATNQLTQQMKNATISSSTSATASRHPSASSTVHPSTSMTSTHPSASAASTGPRPTTPTHPLLHTLASSASDAASTTTTTAQPSSVATPSTSSNRIQVAAASKWTAKSYEGLVEGGVKQVEHANDWTYTTKYRGSVTGKDGAASTVASSASSSAASSSFTITPTTSDIPLTLLSRPDPFLWYDSFPLFEDELHDNGVAVLTIKIRVMQTCFLVLLQFWLRVDDILIRLYDTRVYHEFGTNLVQREQTLREDSFEELVKRGLPKDSKLYADPNVVGKRITVREVKKEMIMLGGDAGEKKAEQAKEVVAATSGATSASSS